MVTALLAASGLHVLHDRCRLAEYQADLSPDSKAMAAGPPPFRERARGLVRHVLNNSPSDD